MSEFWILVLIVLSLVTAGLIISIGTLIRRPRRSRKPYDGPQGRHPYDRWH